MNRKSIPLGVQLISAFYVFGAMVLLLSLFTNPDAVGSSIAERHGLSPSIGAWILPLIAGLALIIAYGLWSLSRWGFYLTLAYLVYFGVVSIVLGGLNFALTATESVQVYFGNFLWSALVVTYLIWMRKRFFVNS
jgi:hypothetical protein